MLEKIRLKIIRWLRLIDLWNRFEKIEKENKFIMDRIKEVEDSAILGIDLGYREKCQVIIIKYSKLNNAFEVIADTESQFPSYNAFVRDMRGLCKKHNVEVMALDNFQRGPDLRARILPDKGILDTLKGEDL